MKKLWGLVLGLALLAPFEARADWCYSYNTSPTYNGGGERIPQNCGLYGQTKVTLTDSSGNEVSVGGGTQYDEDTAHVSGDKVTLAGVVQKTADAALAADGDRTVLQVDSSGYLKVNVKAGAAGGVSVPEDQAHSNGENVVPIACRRIDTAATSAGTSGDWATVDCDANGALRVRIDSSAIGSTSNDEDGTISSGTTGMSESLVRQYEYDGTNFVRVRGQNTVAHDAADAGNPLKIGAKAESSISGATAVADGDRTNLYAGLDGVLIVRPHSNLEDRVSGTAGITDGSSTSVVAAQGAGIRFCATMIVVSNSSATNVTVDIRDGTAGTVLMTIPAAANMGGGAIPLQTPLCTTANTIFAADPSASASTVAVTAVGFKTAL